jgi:hypothetical protein
LELASWRERFGLTAGITTKGPTGAFSLGLWSGTEPVGDALARWGAFRAAVAPGAACTVFSRQVHGVRVRLHAGAGQGWLLVEGFDAHVTAEPGVLLTVSVADCVPVYLAASDGSVIGLVHAGWRGVAGRVLAEALAVFGSLGVPSGDVVMHCGVGICGACYEVSSDVYAKVTGRTVSGPTRVDLRAELARQAGDLGVAEVSESPYCAAHDRALFHSHRAGRGRAGRMIAYITRP